jgi:hypothetical protein
MSPNRKLLVAVFLGASSLVHAEDATPDNTPVAATAPTPLSESLDPVTDTPLVSELPSKQAAAPSSNVTVNLIGRLVQKGILTQAEAVVLVQQAEADAATAAQNTVLPPNADDTRVSYVPEVVRNNLRDQIKQELMAAAREEKWSEKSSPDWTSKFRPFGDIRGRYESTVFPQGNDNTGFFPNFNAINTGAPYDDSDANLNFYPTHNTDQDRHRTRLRARFGTDIMLGDSFNGGIRLATGESNSPTSPNQTLGGSGGSFSKYAIWLDRAFLSYDAGPGDGQELVFLMGRFDNPFFSTDIQWDDDLGFDGLAVRGKVKVADNVSSFFTAGYFPVFNTDFNFSSNYPEKVASTDKWLSGSQFGIEWKITNDLTAKFGIAYYDFNNIEGKLSSPVTTPTANELTPMISGLNEDGEVVWVDDSRAGLVNTDATRPGFAQRGNTYMKLRDIIQYDGNDNGGKDQYQYYGLASEFRNLTITGKIDYDHFDPVRISLLGEATKNLAFEKSQVAGRAVNNFGSAYDGGDSAWNLAFQVGKPAFESFGDWQASFGYRYVESDAVVDGFTDSDFGGGGTNVQGYTLGANVALSRAVRCGLRWMSSDEIIGSPLSADTFQFDINAKF